MQEREITMWQLLKNTIQHFSNDDCPRIAAALAYYTVFSLAPLLVIIMTICGLFLDTADVQGQISYEIRNVAGKNAAEQVQHMVTNMSDTRRGIVPTLIGVGILFFGSTGIMVQLQAALNQVWDVKPDPDAGGAWNFLTKRVLSLAMVLGIAFLLLVSFVVSWALKALGEGLESYLPGEAPHWVWVAGHELTLFFVATILFATMFKFLPDATIQWQDVTVGAAITAGFFVLGKFAIGLYLGSSQVADAYGAAGSLVMILVWVYYSAMIFLLGAEFTQAWTSWCGRRVRPEHGAAKVVEREFKVEKTTEDENSDTEGTVSKHLD